MIYFRLASEQAPGEGEENSASEASRQCEKNEVNEASRAFFPPQTALGLLRSPLFIFAQSGA